MTLVVCLVRMPQVYHTHKCTIQRKMKTYIYRMCFSFYFFFCSNYLTFAVYIYTNESEVQIMKTKTSPKSQFIFFLFYNRKISKVDYLIIGTYIVVLFSYFIYYIRPVLKHTEKNAGQIYVVVDHKSRYYFSTA